MSVIDKNVGESRDGASPRRASAIDGGRARVRPRRQGADMLDVAVVGGGMVGAAASLALAQAGFNVASIEAREPRAWRAQAEVDLRVVALAPSSTALLQQLGVWRAITQARASAYQHMHVWDAESGATLDFDAASEGRDTLGWIVENALLQSVLWQALGDSPVSTKTAASGAAVGVRRLCPATVTAFTAHEDHIHIDLADAPPVQARLLVAADGAASPLRVQAGIATKGHDYQQRGVAAHVTCERAHQGTAWQRFLRTGPLALLPLADGRCSIVWTLPDDEARRVLEMDDAAFCQAVGVASDFRLGRVLASTPRAAFPLKLQLAETYQAERMVLLGDAAHVVHPLAGQGVNLGLRDVTELRDTLLAARAAGRDIGAASVLRRYARRRRSADTLDARAFDGLAHAFDWQAAPLLALRGLGMRAFDALTPLKRALSAHAAGR